MRVPPIPYIRVGTRGRAVPYMGRRHARVGRGAGPSPYDRRPAGSSPGRQVGFLGMFCQGVGALVVVVVVVGWSARFFSPTLFLARL